MPATEVERAKPTRPELPHPVGAQANFSRTRNSTLVVVTKPFCRIQFGFTATSSLERQVDQVIEVSFRLERAKKIRPLSSSLKKGAPKSVRLTAGPVLLNSRRRQRCEAGRGSSSDFRIVLLPAPSLAYLAKWPTAGFVPGHSGGSARDSHPLPSCSALSELQDRLCLKNCILI